MPRHRWTLKDTAFADLAVTAIGNLDFGASLATTRSGSGETLTTNGLANGFQDLSPQSDVALIKLTSDNSRLHGSTTVVIFQPS